MTPKEKMNHLATFLDGMATGLATLPQPMCHNPASINVRETIVRSNGSTELFTAASWLREAAQHVCGQGYFGCNGGEKCGSDHK